MLILPDRSLQSVKRMSIIAILLAICLPVRGAFRASAVKVDITPNTPQWLMGYGPRTSTGVHDPIFHRIVALDDGNTQFYLIVSDLCLFSPGFYDEPIMNGTAILPPPSLTLSSRESKKQERSLNLRG